MTTVPPASAAPAAGANDATKTTATAAAPAATSAPTPTRAAPAPPATGADPARFLGAGVAFKGKLIGFEDVPDSRGDKMCTVSMAKLKAVVLAMKEHKPPITVTLTLDGLKIIDDKSLEVLHTHQIHRISFIFRDLTDARAFGYIYKRDDGGHQFFAIKTERPAEFLVNSIRDLFTAVYNIVKKEADAQRAAKAAAAEQAGETKAEEEEKPDLLNLNDGRNVEAAEPESLDAWLLSTFDPSISGAGTGAGAGPQAGGGAQPPAGYFPPQFAQMTSQQQMFYAQQSTAWPAANSQLQHQQQQHQFQQQQQFLQYQQQQQHPYGQPFPVHPQAIPGGFQNFPPGQMMANPYAGLPPAAAPNGPPAPSGAGGPTAPGGAINPTYFRPFSAPLRPDPFAGLANLAAAKPTPAAAAAAPTTQKKIGKEDFAKETPKQSLLDLGAQQQGAAANQGQQQQQPNPFVSADDTFA